VACGYQYESKRPAHIQPKRLEIFRISGLTQNCQVLSHQPPAVKVLVFEVDGRAVLRETVAVPRLTNAEANLPSAGAPRQER
jgi:hypothetical protein